MSRILLDLFEETVRNDRHNGVCPAAIPKTTARARNKWVCFTLMLRHMIFGHVDVTDRRL